MPQLKDIYNANKDKNVRKKNKGRIGNFFKGVIAELKKVHWPTKKELANYTGVVVAVVLVMAAIISAFDWIMTTLLGLVIS